MKARTRPKTGTRDIVAYDIGRFVACVASFELEIDDLFGLSNSRIDVLSLGLKKYPVQLSAKVKALPMIAGEVQCEWHTEKFSNEFNDVISFRQLLVHGRVTDIRDRGSEYEFCVAKFSLPENKDNRQKLSRTTVSISEAQLLEALRKMCFLELEIEKLRDKVFRAGDGWPSFAPMPSGNPFRAAALISNEQVQK